MSLLNNSNKKGGKKDNKQAKNAIPGAGSSFMKPNKQANIAKKPIKTGGARGS